MFVLFFTVAFIPFLPFLRCVHIHAPPSHILHQGLSLFLVSMDYLSIDYMQLKPSRIPKSNCSLRMVSCNEFYASFSQISASAQLEDYP